MTTVNTQTLEPALTGGPPKEFVRIAVNGKDLEVEKRVYTADEARKAARVPPADQLFKAAGDLEDVSSSKAIDIQGGERFFTYPRGADIRCPQPWLLDANTRYQNAIGVISSLAAGAMLFPIMFIRQVAGVPQGQPIGNLLDWRANTAVGLLGFSILSAILYYYGSAKWMKIAWNQTPDMFWVTVGPKKTEHFLDWTYFSTMTCFMAGIAFMIAFVGHATKVVTGPPQKAEGPPVTWQFIGAIQNFDPGVPCSAKPSIDSQIKVVRQRLATAKPGRILVVGSSDVDPLLPVARQFIGNDALLARLRAECVQTRLLSDSSLVGTAFDPSVAMPTDFSGASPLDRTVFVYVSAAR